MLVYFLAGIVWSIIGSTEILWKLDLKITFAQITCQKPNNPNRFTYFFMVGPENPYFGLRKLIVIALCIIRASPIVLVIFWLARVLLYRNLAKLFKWCQGPACLLGDMGLWEGWEKEERVYGSGRRESSSLRRGFTVLANTIPT